MRISLSDRSNPEKISFNAVLSNAVLFGMGCPFCCRISPTLIFLL